MPATTTARNGTTQRERVRSVSAIASTTASTITTRGSPRCETARRHQPENVGHVVEAPLRDAAVDPHQPAVAPHEVGEHADHDAADHDHRARQRQRQPGRHPRVQPVGERAVAAPDRRARLAGGLAALGGPAPAADQRRAIPATARPDTADSED